MRNIVIRHGFIYIKVNNPEALFDTNEFPLFLLYDDGSESMIHDKDEIRNVLESKGSIYIELGDLQELFGDNILPNLRDNNTISIKLSPNDIAEYRFYLIKKDLVNRLKDILNAVEQNQFLYILDKYVKVNEINTPEEIYTFSHLDLADPLLTNSVFIEQLLYELNNYLDLININR